MCANIKTCVCLAACVCVCRFLLTCACVCWSLNVTDLYFESHFWQWHFEPTVFFGHSLRNACVSCSMVFFQCFSLLVGIYLTSTQFEVMLGSWARCCCDLRKRSKWQLCCCLWRYRCLCLPRNVNWTLYSNNNSWRSSRGDTQPLLLLQQSIDKKLQGKLMLNSNLSHC